MQSDSIEALFARYGPAYRWLACATVMLGTISAVLTTTSVNVAIPDIMGAFGIGQDRAQWLSTGTLAAMTIGMLLNSWLLKSFGQRRTFIGALSIFVVALLVAGASPNENVLILCRIAQGAIAGILQPLAMYTLFKVFPSDQRGTAMGLFGMSVILGPAFGPTLGGILIEHFNWRYVFYVAVPFSLAGILLGSVFMPEREETGPREDFDWIGFLFLAVGMGALLSGLSNGQREGWDSNFIVTLLTVASVSGALFFWWESRVDQPLVQLKVLFNGRFASAGAVACLFGAGLFGSVYLVPLFVQTVQGYTPLAAGKLLAPAGIMLGLFMPIGGYLSDHVPARALVVSGLLCFALSSYVLAEVDVNMPFWTIAWAVVLSRIGLGLIKPSLNVTALRALPSEYLTQGAGLINFARQLGGAFGVNLLSVTLDRRTFFHSDTITGMQTAGNSGTAELLRQVESLLSQAGVAEDVLRQTALHYLGRIIHAQAYTMGFQDAFLITAVLFTLGLIPAWIMGRTPEAVR